MITHDAILAALAELRTTAEAAAPEWQNVGIATTGMPPFVAPTVVVEHAATWSPAAALRWLSWAEQVAARHHPAVGLTSTEVVCWWCSPRAKDWPCPDLAGLAGALGLEET